MNNVYFVVDDRIAFIPGAVRANGLVCKQPIESLVCEYGVLIPTSAQFASFLDYRKTGIPSDITCIEGWTVGVVDKHGALRDYFLNPTAEWFSEARTIIGKGVRSVRARSLDDEEIGYSALQLADSLEDVLALYCKSTAAKRKDFVIHKIADLAKLAADYKAPENEN